MPTHTGPPKVEGVIFGNNIVKNGKIRQDVTWNVPVLRYNVFEHYIIRFADSFQALLNKLDNSAESEEPNTTLQLDFSTSNITYYVHVALKPTRGRGDFSDPVTIAYTSECLWAQVYTGIYVAPLHKNIMGRWQLYSETLYHITNLYCTT